MWACSSCAAGLPASQICFLQDMLKKEMGAGLPRGAPDADLLNLYSGTAGLTSSLAQLVHSGSAQACGLAQLMTHETRQCVPSPGHLTQYWLSQIDISIGFRALGSGQD